MDLDSRLARNEPVLTDDSVSEMLELAERLRSANGGVLDDSALQAVAEATGAPLEYVRLAIRLRPENKAKGIFPRLRSEYLALEQTVRQTVLSGTLGAICALLRSLEIRTGEASYGIFGIVALLFLTVGLYNLSVSKDSKVAAVSGAVFGGVFFAAGALFAFMLRLDVRVIPPLLIPYVLLGALGGLALHALVTKYRSKLGLKDPAKERQDLLRQLVDLQEKLRSGEQRVTFLSVDIVGSTRMKALADALSVEFTFNEYHQFVESITRRHGGRVHSTAGDGVTCAFDHPQQAFAAARNIQTGIIELNTHRNTIGQPIVVRCGVHTGNVVTPKPGEITSLNFATVIDVSAHLQKMAPPGGIVVSDAAAMYITGGPAKIGSERVESMDVEGTIWRPRMRIDAGEPGSPPPLPEGV